MPTQETQLRASIPTWMHSRLCASKGKGRSCDQGVGEQSNMECEHTQGVTARVRYGFKTGWGVSGG